MNTPQHHGVVAKSATCIKLTKNCFNVLSSATTRVIFCGALFFVTAALGQVSAADETGEPAGTGSLASDSIQAVFSAIETSEYELNWQSEVAAYMAPNRAHNLRFTFLDDGFSVVPREQVDPATWSLRLAIAAYGRDGAETSSPELQSWEVVGNKARVRGNGIVIDYVNDTSGLRQNFTITERPRGSGLLRLDFLLTRTLLDMQVDASRNEVYFLDVGTRSRLMLRYYDLHVFDADAHALGARMIQTDEDTFSILVDDKVARYSHH